MSNEEVCLVTGGSGMIGSAIVDYLVEEHKEKVVVLDPNAPWFLAKKVKDENVLYIHGTSFDASQVRKIGRLFDVKEIYDIGALLGSEELMPRLDSALTWTTLGARNVAELALDTGAKSFYILTEFSTGDYCDFTDGYTISKNAAADVWREYKNHNKDLELITARVHHVFSERQQLLPCRKLLPTLIAYKETGTKFKILGESSRDKLIDYVYAKDVARIFVECVKNFKGSFTGKEIPLYDVGGCEGNQLTVKELCELLEVDYVVTDDCRKQPNVSMKATNNWKGVIGDFKMKRLDEMMPYVVGTFRMRFSDKDYEMAVKIFENRFRWGV